MKNVVPAEVLNQGGIYCIKNKLNERVYIGSAKHLSNRYKQHRSHLLKGRHHSIKLQRFANKYGIDKLEFTLIETCELNNLISREQYWLDYYNSAANGFNSRTVADSNLGIKHSAETIEKYRISSTGRKQSYESVRLRADKIKGNKWNVGKKQSAESNAKRSQTLKTLDLGKYNRGKKQPPSVIDKRMSKIRGVKKPDFAIEKYKEIAQNRPLRVKLMQVAVHNPDGELIGNYTSLLEATIDFFLSVYNLNYYTVDEKTKRKMYNQVTHSTLKKSCTVNGYKFIKGELLGGFKWIPKMQY